MGTVEEKSRDATDGEAGEFVGAVKDLFDRYHTVAVAAASGPSDPWIAKVFFVEDEPSPGKMDICCAMINTSRKLAMMRETLRAAFLVAGDHPDARAHGSGSGGA